MLLLACPLLFHSLTPSKDSTQLAEDEVDNLEIIGPQWWVGFDDHKCIIDDGQEHTHQADVHHAHVEEEPNWTPDRYLLQLIEIKAAQSNWEQSLGCTHEATIVDQNLAKDNICELCKGKEVDEEDNGKVPQIPGGHLDCISKHAHASVELEHLDEFDSGDEHYYSQEPGEELIPDGDGYKVHIVT